MIFKSFSNDNKCIDSTIKYFNIDFLFYLGICHTYMTTVEVFFFTPRMVSEYLSLFIIAHFQSLT